MDLGLLDLEGEVLDVYADLPHLLPLSTELSVTPVSPSSPERNSVPELSSEKFLSQNPAQRGLAFQSPARRGFLFQRVAQRGLLYTILAQRGLLFLSLAQRGLLFPSWAQNGLPFPRSAYRPCS